MADLEADADDACCEGRSTGRVLECVGVCPVCRGRDAGREGGVVCGTVGRVFCVLGVGDGVGPFEGTSGASIVCDEVGVEGRAAVVGAGLASRLDTVGVAVPPR